MKELDNMKENIKNIELKVSKLKNNLDKNTEKRIIKDITKKGKCKYGRKKSCKKKPGRKRKYKKRKTKRKYKKRKTKRKVNY